VVEYLGLFKTFDAPVLAGVDLTVESGETMAILGPSGTGKSVLLKTTIGLITPDRGDVRVDGESVFFGGRGTLERIRRKVGYVFQNAALFDSMTVLDNLAQGISEPELKRLKRRELLLRAGEAIEHVNLDPRVVLGKLPSELSGGMRKRVGLARAIIGRPEILLYDEPVTGLDPMNSAIIHRLMAHLAEALGITSIIVTHEVEGALAISDRVALLESGKIRFVGTPADFQQSTDPLARSFLGGHYGADATREALEAV
jgi:phospholipid/cholesterol/gamma-HCH transport system ATP-binding protein